MREEKRRGNDEEDVPWGGGEDAVASGREVPFRILNDENILRLPLKNAQIVKRPFPLLRKFRQKAAISGLIRLIFEAQPCSDETLPTHPGDMTSHF